MRRLALLLPTVLLLFAAVDPARARERAGGFHENPRWGFAVRAPVGWERRVVRLDEPWIADKFFPDHPLRARGEGGAFREHVPSLWVVGFPHARKEGLAVENPYEDYVDFVKREEWASVGEGGWFVARDETLRHADHDVRVVEIKVEKLVAAPLRVVAWIYRCDDVDFAVQVTILEDHWEENRAALEHCLRSFRPIPRTEPFPEAARSLEEIYLDRVDRIEARIAAEIDRLPRDWLALQSKHFVCLSQVDKQHTRYVLNFAEEIRDYLDENFEELGEERIPKGLLRVFATPADEAAYQQGTRAWWTQEVDEITLTFGRGANILGEFSGLATRLTDQYFHIKNENLERAMPEWLRAGIWGHIAWARPSKRKKMVLAPRPHVVRSLAVLFAQEKELSLYDLMTKPVDTFDPEHRAQAESVVYWLLGRGNRGKVKGALQRYLLAIEEIVKEEDEAFELEEESRWRSQEPPKTEAEEDERFRERRARREAYSERLAAKWTAIRERAVFAAFDELKEKDWQRLDKQWKRFAKP